VATAQSSAVSMALVRFAAIIYDLLRWVSYHPGVSICRNGSCRSKGVATMKATSKYIPIVSTVLLVVVAGREVRAEDISERSQQPER
jgi:hypothetical protein